MIVSEHRMFYYCDQMYICKFKMEAHTVLGKNMRSPENNLDTAHCVTLNKLNATC